MISEGSQTEFRLALVQTPVALNESNRGEISWMCASANMAVYAINMTKVEVNGNLVTLQPGSSQLFSENKDDKKGHWKWNLWCTPVKAKNMNID